MTSKTKEILREWLWADYQLYTYFKEKFEKTIGVIDTTYLQSEMEELQYLNNNLKEKCQAEVVDNESLKGTIHILRKHFLGWGVNFCLPLGPCLHFYRVI